MSQPIDVVYTWVDDEFPGYKEELRKFAGDKRDTNPNRTRDNLDLIKYSLRSISRNMPFVRRIYLLTCRPQKPAWLDADHSKIRIVHHDEVMAADILPTFNSFAIVSHLHMLPGLSDRFVYMEDDMLIPHPVTTSDFTSPDGRPLVFTRRKRTPVHADLDPAISSPWNLALATANAALDREFGPKRHAYVIHGPRLIDRQNFQAMVDRFPEEFKSTRTSRFRANGNVPGEYLYPHFLLETGKGALATRAQSRRMEGYASLENFTPWTALQMKMLEWRKPKTITLNDSFEHSPNPAVVKNVRNTLERWFPEPSPFERPG
ncbi:stealth conserved region 3 domain-containing protein [Rhizobiales bacterium]|uniref:stealth conserved region 3 domain-containing protein n=1 Tax=Hongsoonwoonella zoysiae TaxID=2821844 RepID=UPI001561170C|nr:stealth conserved region 3 domain-containing protein [Hongsoonwoonella zoysiae]NRG16648.1 stealth conserved region 3 domain-containing protein [Hongsoonwoonella zoysiae]